MMATSLIFCLKAFFFLHCALGITNEQRGVDWTFANTTYGRLKGFVDHGYNVPVRKFFGIPFAKPPVGSLRFKAPTPPEKWDGIRDAFHHGHGCVQQLTSTNPKFGHDVATFSEDCLYLNVYAPHQSNPQDVHPVMVWIHGGGYQIGSGSYYDATSLASYGVVLVTINYRLDLFGFLSKEDDVLPGNYGMLDQIAALKWVKDNIGAFGGNPDQVTLFGESAGSSSISLHMFSPLSKGLFNRAIMESGASLTPWTMYHKGFTVPPNTVSKLISEAVGCHSLDNSTQLLACLQQSDASLMLNVSQRISQQVFNRAITPLMVPRVETTFGFLPDTPSRLLSKGEFNNVGTIRGFNTDELGVIMTYFGFNPNLQLSRDNALKMIPEYLTQFDKADQQKIMTLLEKTYFPPTNASNEDLRRATLTAIDDLYLDAPTVFELNAIAPKDKDVKHFLYQFDRRPSCNASKSPDWIKAVHGEEMFFLFNISDYSFVRQYGKPDSEDVVVSEQIMTLWTNFARTGNPTSEIPKGVNAWKPYSPSQPNYLLIDAQSESKVWARPQIVDFFKEIVEIYDGPEARKRK